MGEFDSSLTRVQPVFDELIERDPTGRSWLRDLLQAAPHADVLPREILEEPGELLPAVAGPHPEGKASRACFEHAALPPEDLLRWSIENAHALRWPDGRAGEFGAETESKRRALVGSDAGVVREALAELDRAGASGATRKWWAFEGITRVDCWLETDRLVLFVEGKRTEPLSSKTAWLPARNQLARNLDAIRNERGEKAGVVLLAVEANVEEPSDDELREAAPHLGESAAEELRSRYLGQLTWQDICESTGIDFQSLPNRVGDRD